MTPATSVQTAVRRRRSFYHPLQKDTATFLDTSAETDGARTLLEVELAPGGGNPLHRHLTYAEEFSVREGTLTVRVGTETLRLAPGESAAVPAGTAHCFANETALPVVFRVELRPGHVGFERALQAGYGLAEDGRTWKDGTPKSLYELAVLLEWSEIALTGPQRLLRPLLGALARRARRKGIDRRLQARYCAW